MKKFIESWVNNMFYIRNKWSKKDRLMFLDKLHTYLNAGLKLDEAVSLCAYGTNSKISGDISSIVSDLKEGMSLSSSVSNRVDYSNTVVNIIKTGEDSGKLTDTLSVAHSLMKKQDELIKKIISSMTYPILIGIFASVLVIGLVRGVIPEIVPMLHGMKVKLPIVTKVVILLSDILVDYGLWIVLFMFIFIFLLIWMYRHARPVRKWLHYILMYIPVAGSLILKISLSNFFRSVGSTLSSVVDVDIVCKSAVDSIGLIPLKNSFKNIPTAVAEGGNISVVIMNGNIKIPEFVYGLISAGEKSGTLHISMLKVSDILDNEIEHSLKRLTSIIEPVLMIILGVFVSVVALSIVLPIYDMSKSLQI